MRLDAQRLSVRPFRLDDRTDLHAYLSLPTVYRFEPGEPIDEETAGRLARERAAGSDFWAIELHESGRVIGHCSFRPVDTPVMATRELGFIVSPLHQGRGYAAEAGAALVDHAFASLGVHRVVAHCHPANVASWRTLERIGFVREGRLRQNVWFRRDAEGRPSWQDTLAYGLLASDRALHDPPDRDEADVQRL
jgi:RimJ/RimL family protein N-acetyltransferase